jgi:pimeloyl-ACP methyl ester carboxylesterase
MMFTKKENTMQDKEPKRKKGPLIWIKRGLVGLGIGLVVLALIGATYQSIATQIDKRTYPPPGEIVDVGDHSLHINCMGQGSPTVILEAANLGMSSWWVRVQQQAAKTTRVCAYDRAGMGWSESGPEPRDAKHISSELHTLLGNAGIEGPYVLTGHSYGGLYARMYAARYSEEVAGVVLIDSMHPEQFTRSAQGRAMYEQTQRMATIAPLISRFGVIRLFNLLPAHPDLPPQQREQIEAFNSSSRQVATTAEEFRATSQTTAQVRSAGSLGDKPLAVVTAGGQSGPGWPEMQEELAALSSDSTHRVVEGATHASLLYERHDAQETIGAILRVVEAVRTDQPLTK